MTLRSRRPPSPTCPAVPWLRAGKQSVPCRAHVGGGDPELLHPRKQRRALETETQRRAARTGDDAVRLTEHLADVLAHGEGLTGILLVGWSTAFVFAVVNRMYEHWRQVHSAS